MGTLLLVYVRDAHSQWGRFCTFSSGLPVAGGMSLEEARLGPVFCLPRTRHTLMLTTTDTNRYASSVRADSETGKGCVSYSDVL